MALADLLQAMEADAAAELERARAEAEAEARAIREQAGRDADALEQRLARAGDEAVRREAAAIVSRARLDASATVRAAREDAWQTVAAVVRDELAATRDRDEWPALLAALVHEGRVALPGATTVRVDPRDAGCLAATVTGGLAVEADLDTWGGAVLEAPDGRRLDNTLEARLRAAEPALRARLAALLAGEPERAAEVVA
jgi:vacuolar-type H+-ATPase subunit E/Vma4